MLPSRRAPARIALELLDCIDGKNGKASKWDLIKIVGTESQFHYWLKSFCLKTNLLKSRLSLIISFTGKLKLESFCSSF
jgi:hypothetical protein